MSITDELREYTEKQVKWLDVSKVHYRKLFSIADRIDAEHQKAEDEWRAKNGDMWQKGYAVCHEELMEGHPVIAADLEKAGWVRLPKDADGEPIHVGDVMEWVRYENDDPTIVRKVSAVGAGAFFAWSDEQGRYAQYEAHAYRHYHAPTVEDVLRQVIACANNGTHVHGALDTGQIVAEYAARLRLAEGEDA